MYTNSMKYAAIASACLVTNFIAADVLHVAPCGDDAWTGVSAIPCAAPDGPKRTIQAAIDDAEDGDTVELADGIYTGPGNRDMDFGGKAITIRSASGDPGLCIIDCGGTETEPHRAFWFHMGETDDSVLDGLTVQNGYTNRGGAVLCEAGSSPHISNCIFSGNIALPAITLDGGGAIYIEGSDPHFENCEFIENQARVTLNASGGGAIRMRDSRATLTTCYFQANTATASGPDFLAGTGGAIYLGGQVNSDVSPTIVNCTFIENRAQATGGGVGSRRNTGNPLLIDCLFDRNTITHPAIGSGAGFGAFQPEEMPGHTMLVNCRFIANHSEATGGGVGFGNCTATVVNCSLIGNRAINGNGGGAMVGAGVARVTFSNCLFNGNSAFSGGGLATQEDTPTVAVNHCTFVHNQDDNFTGGAIRCRAGVINVRNSILWENTPNEILVDSAGVFVQYSDVQLGWPGTGNINADPLFADADGPDNVPGTDDDDLRLTAESPCIDAGDPAFHPAPCEHDLDGACRVWDGNSDTSVRVDMGAFEFAAPRGDLDADCQIGLSDLTTLLSNFGTTAGALPRDGDLDIDDDVDLADLTILLSSFGATCP